MNPPPKESSLLTSQTKPKEATPKPKASGGEPQKTKQQMIEEERRKAEEKIQRRLKKAQEKKETEEAAATPPTQRTGGGKSYGGYEGLQGNILHIQVEKVVKKLGIAIDGGANTKQKAVIIREISVSGTSILLFKPPAAFLTPTHVTPRSHIMSTHPPTPTHLHTHTA